MGETAAETVRRPEGVSRLEYAKKAGVAAFAGTLAVVGSLTVAVTAGSDGGAAITAAEWLQAAWVGMSAAGGAVGVYFARNVTTPRPRQRAGNIG